MDEINQRIRNRGDKKMQKDPLKHLLITNKVGENMDKKELE